MKLKLDGTEVHQLERRMSRKLSLAGEFREGMGRHLSWAPHASDHQLRAILHDTISAMATASGRKLRWLETDRKHHFSVAHSVSALSRRLSNLSSGRVELRAGARKPSERDAEPQARVRDRVSVRVKLRVRVTVGIRARV